MKAVNFSVILMVVLGLILPMAYAATLDSALVSISLLNQDPDPAIAGNIVEVRFGVENLGGEAQNNLMIELVPEYPFELVPGANSIQKISKLNAYQDDQNMVVVKYRILVDKDARSGTYDLVLDYHEDGSTIVAHKTLLIDVGIKESAEIIHIDKTLLVPGKQTGLKFTINNVGNAPLRDLRFSWENEDKIILPVGSDNTRYIKYIDVDGSAELEYQVIADTNAVLGLYQLDLLLTYDESATDTQKTISTIAGVYVGGGTDFDVAYSESSDGQISFSIANIGSNPANSVAVMIPEQRGWSVTGSSSYMIGNLNKGDYTVASFNLQSMAANRTLNRDVMDKTQDSVRVQRTDSVGPLTVQIAYTDTMGERNIVEKEVDVQAESGFVGIAAYDGKSGSRGVANAPSGFFTKYGNCVLVVILLIVAVFIYMGYRKRKLMDPDFKLKNTFARKNK